MSDAEETLRRSGELLDRAARWDALLGIGAEREAVEEVERLRVMNADLRIMIDGLEAAAHEERAAVVAWLTRTHGWACDDCGFNIADLADAIEHGEHRREEER